MTQQIPINTGFGASTTASEVIRGRDLRGKVAIVTGGASGLGLASHALDLQAADRLWKLSEQLLGEK